MAAKETVSIIVRVVNKGVDLALRQSRRAIEKFKAVGSKAMGALATGAKLAAAAIGTGLVGAALAGALALADSAQAAITNAEAFDKMSQRVGVSVETLSQLEFAAEQSGAGLGDLEVGLRTLSRAVAGALEGQETYTAAFDRLGISLKDQEGNLKDQEQILNEVADAFSGYADDAAKTAAAQELFGRSGARLIPLLNQGADGIGDLRQQADELGRTIRTDTSKQAAQLLDDMNRLRSALVGAGNAIATKLLPYLTPLAKALADNIQKVGILEGAWKSFTDFVNGELNVKDTIKTQLKETREEIKELELQLAMFEASAASAPSAAADALVERTKEKLVSMRAVASDFANQLFRMANDDFPEDPFAAEGEGGPGQDVPPSLAAKMGIPTDEQFETLFQKRVEQQAKLEEERRKEAERQAEMEEGFRNEKLESSLRGMESLQSAEESHAQHRLSSAATLFGALANLASLGGSKMFGIRKKFAKAEALVNVAQGATRALTLPFPENIAAMAKTLVAGRQQIKALDQASPGGGSLGGAGGSLGGGGGSGGGGGTGRRPEPASLEKPERMGPAQTINFTIQNPMGSPEEVAFHLGKTIEGFKADGLIKPANVSEVNVS